MKEKERQTALDDCLNLKVVYLKKTGKFLPAIVINQDDQMKIINPNTLKRISEDCWICGRGDWLERYTKIKLIVKKRNPSACDSTHAYEIKPIYT
jgi:hypothetical protein